MLQIIFRRYDLQPGVAGHKFLILVKTLRYKLEYGW